MGVISPVALFLFAFVGVAHGARQFNLTATSSVSISNELKGCTNSRENITVEFLPGGERSFALLKFPLSDIFPPSPGPASSTLSLYLVGTSDAELQGRLEVIVVKSSWDAASVTCESVPDRLPDFPVLSLSGYPWDPFFNLDLTQITLKAMEQNMHTLALLVQAEESSTEVRVDFGSSSEFHVYDNFAPTLTIIEKNVPKTDPELVPPLTDTVVAGSSFHVLARIPHAYMSTTQYGARQLPPNTFAFHIRLGDTVDEIPATFTLESTDEVMGYTTYAIHFSPKKTGTIHVTAFWAQQHIHGSPLRIKCLPGPVDPEVSSSEFGSPQYFSTHPLPRVDEESCFLVNTLDTFGNPVDVKERVEMDILAGVDDRPSKWRVQRSVPGALNLCFTPADADMISISVLLGDRSKSLQGFPLEVDCLPGKPVPEKSLVQRPVFKVVAGQFSSLTLLTFDQADHPTNVDLEQTSVTFTGPGDVYHNISLVHDPEEFYTGKSVIWFKASVAGFYQVTVVVEGVTLGPYVLTIVPSSPIPTRAVVKHSPLKATVGHVNTFSIDSFDSFGNAVVVGGMRLHATITPHHADISEAGVDVEIADGEDGSYTVSWVVEKAGDYTITVGQEDPEEADSQIVLEGCPFNVSVAVGQMSVKTSGFLNPPEPILVAGDDPNLYIVERDMYGNLLTEVEPETKITSTLKSSATGDVTVIPVDHIADGTLKVRVSPQVVGEYTVAVKANATAFAEVTFRIVPSTTCPFASVVNHEFNVPVTVNTEVSFTIRARDVFGNDLKEGGEESNLSVEAIHPGTPAIVGSAIDLENGEYAVRFTPTTVGYYNVYLYFKGSPVAESPYTQRVLPAAAFGPFSYAVGTSLREGVAGEWQSFVVRARDSGKNDVLEGGTIVSAYVQRHPDVFDDSNSIILLNVTDNSDGSYSCGYNLTHTGDYSLFVRMDGRDILGSPFALSVKSNLVGSNLALTDALAETGVRAGERFTVTIQAFDKYGNKRLVGGDTVDFNFTNTETNRTFIGTVEDLRNGQYNITASLTAAGIYMMQGSCGGDEIGQFTAGSMFTVSPGFESADHCTVSGPGIASAMAGVQTNFTVNVRDVFYNAIKKGGAMLRATLVPTVLSNARAAKFRPVAIGVTDFGNGTYEFSYTPFMAADYSLHIEMRENVTSRFVDIQGSPLIVTVASNRASGTFSYLAGRQTRVVAGSPAHFVLHAHDEFNNTRNMGGDAVVMRLSEAPNGTVATEVKDDNTGLYYIKFIPEKVGSYAIIGFVNGERIPFQFSLEVVAGVTAASYTSATWSMVDKLLEAGVEHSMSIVPADAYGNPTDGQGVQWSVLVRSGLETAYGNVSRNEAKFIASRAGSAEMYIQVNGENIQGSPHTISIVGTWTSARKTVAAGEGLYNGTAGKISAFRVKPLDIYGNPSTKGPVNVEVLDPDHFTVAIRNSELEDQYEIHFLPVSYGTHEIRIMVGDNHVEGSPFWVLVEPGVAYGPSSQAIGAGLSEVQYEGTGYFRVIARDEYRNNIYKGGDDIAVEGVVVASGAHMSFQIEDLKNGEYNVEYTAPKDGPRIMSGIINVYLNHRPVGGRNYTVTFTSDTANVTCPENCNAHGICNVTTGLCACAATWTGFSCAQPFLICPHNCSSHGQCDFYTGACRCFGGYSGDACEIDPSGTPIWTPPSDEGVSGLGVKQPSIKPPVCPKDCSGHGTCLYARQVADADNDTCVCDPGYVGTGCETRTYYTLITLDQGILLAYEISTGRMTGFQQGITEDKSCSGLNMYQVKSNVYRPAGRKYIHIGGTELLEVDPNTLKTTLVLFKFDDLAKGVVTKPVTHPIGVLNILQGKEATYIGMNRLLLSTDDETVVYRISRKDDQVFLSPLATHSWGDAAIRGKYFSAGHDKIGRYLANSTVSLFHFDRVESKIAEPSTINEILTNLSDFPTRDMVLQALSGDMWFAMDIKTGNYQSYYCPVTEDGKFAGCTFLNDGNLFRGYRCASEMAVVNCTEQSRFDCIKSKQCGYCLSSQRCMNGTETGPDNTICESVDGAQMWIYSSSEFAFNYVYMGQDHVMQFEPATGKYLVWLIDREVKSDKCRNLQGLVGEGYLQNSIGHEILFVGGDILDFNPANGRFRFATCNLAIMAATQHLHCNTWAEGIWPLLSNRKLAIIQKATKTQSTLLMDYSGKTGDYRVWTLGTKAQFESGNPLMRDAPMMQATSIGLIGAEVTYVEGESTVVAQQSITSTTTFYEVVGGRLLTKGDPVVKGVTMVKVDGKQQLLQMRFAALGEKSMLQYGPLGFWKYLDCQRLPVFGDVFGSQSPIHCLAQSVGSPSPPLCNAKVSESECVGNPSCGWCSMTMKCSGGYSNGICSNSEPVCPIAAWKYVGGQDGGGFIGSVKEIPRDTTPPHDCGHSTTCASCVSDTRCGWHTPSQTCALGGIKGPKSVTDHPISNLNLDWNFYYCKGADGCDQIESCEDCTGRTFCGWCPNSNKCITGTAEGPLFGTCDLAYTFMPNTCPATKQRL